MPRHSSPSRKRKREARTVGLDRERQRRQLRAQLRVERDVQRLTRQLQREIERTNDRIQLLAVVLGARAREIEADRETAASLRG